MDGEDYYSLLVSERQALVWFMSESLPQVLYLTLLYLTLDLCYVYLVKMDEPLCLSPGFGDQSLNSDSWLRWRLLNVSNSEKSDEYGSETKGGYYLLIDLGVCK